MESLFDFKDEKGTNYLCKVKSIPGKGYIENKGDICINISLGQGTTSTAKYNYYFSFFDNPLVIRRFAIFLGIKEEFEQFLGDNYKKVATDENGHIVFREGIEKTVYYKQLATRLEKAMKEYHETEFEFYAGEEQKQGNAQKLRKQFLEQVKLVPKLLNPLEDNERIDITRNKENEISK